MCESYCYLRLLHRKCGIDDGGVVSVDCHPLSLHKAANIALLSLITAGVPSMWRLVYPHVYVLGPTESLMVSRSWLASTITLHRVRGRGYPDHDVRVPHLKRSGVQVYQSCAMNGLFF